MRPNQDCHVFRLKGVLTVKNVRCHVLQLTLNETFKPKIVNIRCWKTQESDHFTALDSTSNIDGFSISLFEKIKADNTSDVGSSKILPCPHGCFTSLFCSTRRPEDKSTRLARPSVSRTPSVISVSAFSVSANFSAPHSLADCVRHHVLMISCASVMGNPRCPLGWTWSAKNFERSLSKNDLSIITPRSRQINYQMWMSFMEEPS